MSVGRALCAFLFGLCAGAGAVWLFEPPQDADARHAPAPSVGTAKKRILSEADGLRRGIEAREDRLLRERIAGIERDLRAAKSSLDSAETNAAARSGRPLSYDEWFALQREVDPARYAMLTNGIVRSRGRFAREYAMRAELLDTVDTSSFSAEDASVHAAYRDALSRIAELRREELAMRCVSPDFKADVSPEWRQELEAVSARARELAVRDRFLLLREAGRLHGLSGSEAQELAETMHLILETTSGAKALLKPQREQLYH